jgi:hypothetical protein
MTFVLASRRRRERTRLAAWKAARERAAIQETVTHRGHGFGVESHVPTQGDLICFEVAIRPC